ncbi:MAG: type II toxin-antitoxin system HipA family toxin [Acidobacteria bacterium]|nr:type II toxin-antitoxin system HipA family toxin [Acidobacteriota bacterium]
MMAVARQVRRQIARPVETLEVRVGDIAVGTLARLQDDATFFVFDPAYAADVNRPTLSLGYKGRDGNLVENLRPTRTKLPAFFSNLLPEGHLRQYLASRGAVHPDREFFLLWLVGADLPGAVVATASDGALPPRTEEEEPTHLEDDRPLRFSLAGVQLKFSAVMETSGGLTLPVGGVGGDWIVKLPSSRFKAVPETEYAMMTLAAAVGIQVPEVRLVPTSEISHLPADLPEGFGQTLAIRRFDRAEAGARIHIEDFAQVFNLYPNDKYARASYANIAEVLWAETGEAGASEFVRRLVFNVLIGNGDAHLKNWSLIYPDGRTTTLAPAYDLVGTVAYLPNQHLALSLAGTKDFTKIDADRLRSFAEKGGLPTRAVLRIARETAQAVRDIWPQHEPIRMLPDDIRRAIEHHMTTVPL